MDFMQRLNGFFERKKTHPLKANSVAMYLILLEEANEQRFPDSFPVSHGRIQEDISLYDREFRRAREELVQEGYITYRQGDKCSYEIYSLVPLGQ